MDLYQFQLDRYFGASSLLPDGQIRPTFADLKALAYQRAVNSAIATSIKSPIKAVLRRLGFAVSIFDTSPTNKYHDDILNATNIGFGILKLFDIDPAPLVQGISVHALNAFLQARDAGITDRTTMTNFAIDSIVQAGIEEAIGRTGIVMIPARDILSSVRSSFLASFFDNPPAHGTTIELPPGYNGNYGYDRTEGLNGPINAGKVLAVVKVDNKEIWVTADGWWTKAPDTAVVDTSGELPQLREFTRGKIDAYIPQSTIRFANEQAERDLTGLGELSEVAALRDEFKSAGRGQSRL